MLQGLLLSRHCPMRHIDTVGETHKKMVQGLGFKVEGLNYDDMLNFIQFLQVLSGVNSVITMIGKKSIQC
jgi:hypothetical protein